MYNGGWQNITWTNNLAALNVDGTLNLWDGQNVIVDALAGNGTVTGNSSDRTTSLTVGVNNGSGMFSGVFSTAGGALIKTGSGTQVLLGNNSYTGGTTINQGTLVATNGSSLGTGNTYIGSGGTLTFDTTGGQIDPVAITITGTGTMNITGGNTLVFGAGGGAYQVNVNLSAGAQINLQAGYLETSSWGCGYWYSNQASMYVASGAILGLKEHQVVVDALNGGGLISQDYGCWDSPSLVVGVANGSGTFSGVIQDGNGAASLKKTGGGTQVLSAQNSYTGGTTVNGGRLSLATQNTLNANSPITVNSGAVLSLDAPGGSNTQQINATLTLNGGTITAASGTGLPDPVNIATYGNLYLTGGGAIVTGANSGPSLITADIGLNGPGGGQTAAITVNGGSSLTISGRVAGVSDVSWGGIDKYGDGTLTLTNGSNGYAEGMTLYGGTVEFASGALAMRHGSSPVVRYAADFQGNATLRWLPGNTDDISGNRGNGAYSAQQIKIADGATATFDTNGNNVSFSQPFVLGTNGSGAVVKAGSGTLTLAAANSYTGGTTVNQGTLELHGATAGTGLIQGAVTVNSGATLALTGGDGTGFGWNNTISSLTINGGTVNAIGGSHIGFGTAATVALNNGGTIAGSWQWNGDSMLTFSSSGDSTATISGNLDLRWDGGTNHTVTVADGAAPIDLLVSANLTDLYAQGGGTWTQAGLTKAGAGTMALTGNNSYSGGTTVSLGVLQLGNSAALGTGGLTANGGIVDLAGNSPTVTSLSGSAGTITSSTGSALLTVSQTGATTFSGTLQNSAGTLGLYKTGGGALTLAGINTYSGATTVNAGILQVNGQLTASPVTIQGGSLVLGGTVGNNVTMSGGAIDDAGGTPVISGSLAVTGPSIWRSALATVAQGVDVQAGTLTLDDGATLTTPQVKVSGGAIAGPATSILAGSLLYTSPNSSTFSGVIGGVGNSVTMNNPAATLTLANTCAYTGLTNIQAGTLRFGANSVFSGDVTVSGGTLDTASFGTVAGTITLAGGAIVGGGTLQSADYEMQSGLVTATLADENSGISVGALTKTTAGTLILSGTDTYTGGTFVNEGTLIVTNPRAIADGTSLTVGAGGTFIFDPTVTGSAMDATSLRTVSPMVAPVPEPGTLVLLSVAGIVAAAAAWRRKRRN